MTSKHIDFHCECGDGPASHYTTEQGERCYGWCQGTERDCAQRGYRPIEHAFQPVPWKAMLLALGDNHDQWPTHYSIDLSTDYITVRDVIDTEANDEFIWIVREMGTHLYPLKYLADDTHGFIRQALQYHERNHETAHVFYWDGVTLHRIDWSKARSLVRDYVRQEVLA